MTIELDEGRSDLPQGLGWAVLGLSALATAGLVAVVFLFAQFGGALVSGMDRLLGDVAWRQGLAFEKAGQHENAKECYRLALEGRFASSQDRTDALMRLGTVLWWSEGPDKALPYLEEAYRRPDHTVWLCFPLCDALLKAGRNDEVLEVSAQWYQQAAAAGLPEQQALAKYLEGLAFQFRGDKDQALAAFEEGLALYPAGKNAREAGQLHLERGHNDKAIQYFDIYLKDATDDDAPRIKALRDSLLQGRISE